MKHYIAIDGGTTNVRLYYTEGFQILKAVKYPVGAGNGALAPTVSRGIGALVDEFGAPDAILASGMITSDLGLCCVAHLPIPAGVRELHNGMQRVSLPEIGVLPIWFIPGLKQVSEDFRSCDMMRGEECEIFGLGIDDGVCVLPGSHAKHITVANGKVTAFSTFLSGEMAAALSSATVLKHSVDMSRSLDEEALCAGCAFARSDGLNKALFKARVMDTVYHKSPSEIYSFFLGAVLCAEIDDLAATEATAVLLAGQPRLAEATALLLRHFTDKNVQIAEPSVAAEANVRGMIRIFEA